MDTITIPVKEYRQLKTAEAERDKYRSVCEGRSPKEMDEFFNRLLKEQREIIASQAISKASLERMVEIFEKAGIFQRK